MLDKVSEYFQGQQRLMANTDFNCNHWDVLNTRIYEQVGANVILLNYNDLEEVKDGWLSGKKNDIIIGFIGDYKNPTKVKNMVDFYNKI